MMTLAVEVFGSPQSLLKRQMPPSVEATIWRFSYCRRSGIMVRPEECWMTMEEPGIWRCDFCGETNERG
jgi:hypothetical protein